MSRRAPRARPGARSVSRRRSHERQHAAALGIREIAESHGKSACVSSSNRARPPIESSARAPEGPAKSRDPSGCRRDSSATTHRTRRMQVGSVRHDRPHLAPAAEDPRSTPLRPIGMQGSRWRTRRMPAPEPFERRSREFAELRVRFEGTIREDRSTGLPGFHEHADQVPAAEWASRVLVGPFP